MRSLRTRFMLLTVFAVAIAVVIVTALSVVFIRSSENVESDQLLLLLCETGERNLNYYFDSVQKSVGNVAADVERDLDGLEPEKLQSHIDRMEQHFDEIAYKTNGVLTYYYRIDPAISDTVKGFWYTNLDGEGFEKHEVTDIELYDTSDTSSLVWFTVPKFNGKAVWLPPYITDNLDKRVISYNVPIYKDNLFIGVVGIEIDYSTMAREVDHISLYENGYAFINDDEGNIIYHPRIDVTTMEEPPKTPAGLMSEGTFLNYTFEGVEKQGVWLPLSNGMRLNVTVPVSEINADWQRLVNEIIIVSIILLFIFVVITMRFTGHITKPLRELTDVAEQVNEGNYDCKLDYNGNDEVGVLTKAFNRLISNMKVYISDLNDLAYADALTSVHNKGAFDIYVQDLQTKLQEANGDMEFGVGIFDCNNLKGINDRFGHAKGDIYLKTACALICEVFSHSPVFRIGGDEFAVFLHSADYQNRKELLEKFDARCHEIRSQDVADWERVDVARGIATYHPGTDETVNDVVRYADMLMYKNKWKSKGINKGEDQSESGDCE